MLSSTRTQSASALPSSSLRSFSMGQRDRSAREVGTLVLRSSGMSRTVLPTTTALEADIESLVLKYNLVYDKTVKTKRDFTEFLSDVEIFKAEVKDKLAATEESLASTHNDLSALLKSLSDELHQEIQAEDHRSRVTEKRIALLDQQAVDIATTLQDCALRAMNLETHCGTTRLPL